MRSFINVWRHHKLTLVRIACHGLALVPLGLFVFAGVTHGLGANPIEKGIRELGDWALIILLVSLAVTPVRRLTGWTVLARLRRPIGLWAFAYTTLHVMTYVGVDQFFDWSTIWADILKRTYITLGMVAFLVLMAMAITSLRVMIRWLGGRAWQRLHRLVYGAVLVAVVHYLMMVKADWRIPLLYGVAALVLLGARLLPLERLRTRRKMENTLSAG